jgi:hypothetical protein
MCYETHLVGHHVLQLEQLLIGSPKFDILIHEFIHTDSQGLALCLLSEA